MTRKKKVFPKGLDEILSSTLVCKGLIVDTLKHFIIPEEVIEKHLDLFLGAYQFELMFYSTVSEEFIEKHYDKIDKALICRFQDLTDDFIERHKKDLFLSYIEERRKNKNK